MNRYVIREKIREEMILQNISQADLIRKIKNNSGNLSHAQLSNFLNGKKSLSLKHIESIFEVLNIKLVRIL